MIDRKNSCKACEGTGILSDDEGWQYNCSVCRGKGTVDEAEYTSAKLMSVDENNRLLD